MIAGARLAFDPALPTAAIIMLGLAAFASLALYVWRGGGAPILRALGLAFVFVGLAQPQWVRETREPAEDVALVLVDQSESLALAGRREAARSAADSVIARLGGESGLEVRVRETRGGADGTMIAGVIEDALGDVARDRIGGVVVVTDGQAADAPDNPRRFADLGPIHVLIVGDPARADRRLELTQTPTFGIVGEPMRLAGRVIDARGDAPVRLTLSIDGERVNEIMVRANRPFAAELRLPHRGRNMIVVEAEPGAQEISTSNNRQAFAANGVRDRLRVLLITGEPHPGARVWRNLLKSDPAVDLVHFSILRPPDKQDFTPLHELALIPFPTEELFERRLNEFDLIIFDRAPRRGILQSYYYAQIARRVEQGGALLITAGDSEAGLDGLYRTPLAGILPAQPTGQIIARAYRPAPTALGRRHPVVRGLAAPERWGRWTRQIEARASGGHTLLQGADGKPLLVVDRAGDGRVAQLWSDQPWLWARGYDGGGPHGELLRRLAHWLMQEPELEDERLSLDATARGLEVERSTLGEAPGAIEIIAPSGARSAVASSETSPGLWRAEFTPSEQGLYEARNGGLRAFAAVGALNPREASALAADPSILEPLARSSGGGVLLTGEDGRDLPEIRRISRGARASGANWIGIERNGAYTVRAARASPLGPGWAWAAFGLALLMLGWRRESG
ncbi:MAG: hypothetical protein JNM59_06860 [Hyphomonadaceae bacterium]|nr:hypothetical protein [Hyphomonadaceae bacterium]